MSPFHQCGQKTLYHFMCKLSSLITEPWMRFSTEKKNTTEWGSSFSPRSLSFFWQKMCSKLKQMNRRSVGLCTPVLCVCLFLYVPVSIGLHIYICIFLHLCAFLKCVRKLIHTHTHTGSCPSVNSSIIAINQTLQTHKQIQRLRSRSPLRTHNTLKHPNTPTDQAEEQHLNSLWDKSCDTLSGRCLSKPMNGLIVPLFRPCCRLNWPLQPRGRALFLQWGPQRTAATFGGQRQSRSEVEGFMFTAHRHDGSMLKGCKVGGKLSIQNEWKWECGKLPGPQVVILFVTHSINLFFLLL